MGLLNPMGSVIKKVAGKVLKGAKKADKFLDKYGRGALGKKLTGRGGDKQEEKKVEVKKAETKRTEKRTADIKSVTNRGGTSTTNRPAKRSASKYRKSYGRSSRRA